MSFSATSFMPRLHRLQHGTALVLLLLLSACGGGNSGLPDPPAPPAAAPSITVQPGNRITDEGVPVTFSVQATGAGTLAYQWLRNDVEIAGATQTSHTLSSPAASDNGSLWKVRISNANGSITSSTAILTVNTVGAGVPTITTAPQSQTVSAGASVSFSVNASDATGYQWQRDGSDIAGANSPTYYLAAAEESDNASTWRVIVSNAAGAVTSAAATLTVTAGITSAPVINTHPASQTVVQNGTVTFTVAASGSPAPSFQWQRNGDDIPGATDASHVLASTQDTDNGSTWRVIVTNSAGAVISNSATLAVQPPPPASTAVIAVLAGVLRQPGSSDGSPGSFKLSTGMTIDASGNVYMADLGSKSVRRVSPTGSVLTLTGPDDFNLPAGIAQDTTGNLYVSDIGTHTIRKTVAGGAVTTLAGGTSGYADDDTDDGVSTARFRNPWGVTVDASGNVYVADTGNHAIRKITPTGLVSTLAGGTKGFANGAGSEARFDSPIGIVMGTDGNLYVADQVNRVIRKVTTAGVVTTLAGQPNTSGSADGQGSEARFFTPTGICTDESGNLYVADNGNSLIRKVTLTGEVITVAGRAGSTSVTTGTGGSLNQPIGVTVNSTTGMLYTAGDNAILSITP